MRGKDVILPEEVDQVFSRLIIGAEELLFKFPFEDFRRTLKGSNRNTLRRGINVVIGFTIFGGYTLFELSHLIPHWGGYISFFQEFFKVLDSEIYGKFGV